ncbi:MAG TPA: sugar ABC transporter substrate-binding protein [Solirubrobacteraceae bacterium]|jgi:ribose transport system substrate-binding protein
MLSRRARHRARVGAVVAVLAGALTVAACGSSDSSTSTSSSTTKAAAANNKPVRIAYLSFAVANSYDAPMLAAAQTVAHENNATVQVFDANNDPKKQFAQLQNATSSGDFDAIIVQPIFGTGLITGVQEAITAGKKVVNMDQILGKDLSTDQPQVDGLSGNVVFVPTEIGTKLGKLVTQACQEKSLDPCKVGYLYDIKASALDVAIKKSFDEATSGSPVKIVAQGESFFTPALGLKATQNMMQAHPDLNLIVGSDQGIEGAVQALGKKKVILVGYGGAAAALQGVASGAWYGDVAQLPASEGRLAAQAAIKAVRTGAKSGGQNPVADLPDQGVVTKANADQFTAEWPG